MNTSKTTPLIYLRLSRNRTAEHASVDRQREDCIRLAGTLGFSDPEEFVDESASAYRRSARRPGFQQLMGRIRDLTDAAIIVWHLDRFTRQPAQLEELLLLAETRRIRVESVQGGTFDLATQEGRLFARFLVAFAHYESAHKSTRVRRAHQERERQGHWHGRAVFGYTAEGRLNPPEAAIIRGIVVDYLAGCSEQEIARRLNKRGVSTPTSSIRWYASTVQSILRSQRLHRHSLAVNEVQKRWEPVVSAVESDLIQALILLPKRRPTNSSKSLLGGIASCHECGGLLVVGYSGKGIRRYICRATKTRGSCGNGIAADALDEHVTSVVRAQISEPSKLETTSRMSANTAAALTATQRRLVASYAAGHISQPDFCAKHARIAAAGERLGQEVIDHACHEIRPWGSLDLPERRQEIRRLITSIQVSRRTENHRFDLRRVFVIPRLGASDDQFSARSRRELTPKASGSSS